MKTPATSLTLFRRASSATRASRTGRISRPAIIVCAVLAAFNVAALPALAQTPPVAPGAAVTQAGDPPGRVARLDYMAGAVTTQPAGASDWSYAQLNRPLTTGDQLWNDRNARSELHIGSTAVRMDEQTSLDVLNLDDTSTQLKVAQGTLSTHVRSLPPGSSYEIDTPNLALGVNGPGDYRVDVAPDGSTTTVTVRRGSATVYGDGGQMPVEAGQQVQFAGTNLQQVAASGAPAPDVFDQWSGARDAAEDRSVSARYVSREMPGYQDLDANGSWRDDPQYGDVWVPNAVPAGWAPYHDGHWVWQAPWGWTWVDDAPWGFAPYHYGRWAYVDDTWAWVPGPVVEAAPPVYAPALVAFVGGGGGGVDWGVSLTLGGVAAAGVAWFPLGPGEPWHPRWCNWSPHYYERVNQPVVINNYRNNVNITNITNVHNTYINYRAPGAITAVPATAFVHGQPASRFAQKVDPRQWQHARIESGTPGIAPVRESFGPGLRNAGFRPPASAGERQVVATRRPVAPPAFHDALAQRAAHGGVVPGAGAPVVRTSAPARSGFIGNVPRNPAVQAIPNVRLVPPHSPTLATAGPGHQPPTNGQAERAGQPGAQPGMPAAGAGPQAAQRPGMGAVPGGGARPQPGAPMAALERQPQPGNGVPRPPQPGVRPENGMPRGAVAAGGQQPQPAQANARREPVWTQPHTPMAMQGQPRVNGAQAAPQESRIAPQGGQPMPRTPEAAGQQRQAFAPQGGQPVPHAPEGQGQQRQALMPQGGTQPPHAPEMRAQLGGQPQVQQPRETVRAPQAAAQAPRPQFEPRAPMAAPQVQQPRPEVRAPQAMQPRPEIRPQPQPQPRAEFRPQPQPQSQPQPRAEFHPQPQPQPQPQPRQEFHPQPQAVQPHAAPAPAPAAGQRDEHHHG